MWRDILRTAHTGMENTPTLVRSPSLRVWRCREVGSWADCDHVVVWLRIISNQFRGNFISETRIEVALLLRGMDENEVEC